MTDFNRENMTSLRDQLRDVVHDKHFNMGIWGRGTLNVEDIPAEADYSCGAAACMAGWATVLRAAEKGVREVRFTDGKRQFEVQAWIEGREWLDLDEDEADCLFLPSMWPERFQDHGSDVANYDNERLAAVALLDAILDGVCIWVRETDEDGDEIVQLVEV